MFKTDWKKHSHNLIAQHYFTTRRITYSFHNYILGMPVPPFAGGFAPGMLSFLSSMRGKPRRSMLRRAVFSDGQRKGLEKTFQKQKYISKPDRKKLAEKLGLKDSQVNFIPRYCTQFYPMKNLKWSTCLSTLYFSIIKIGFQKVSD